jgi:hypothetical protein
MGEKESKARSKTDQLAKKIQASLAGKTSGQVTIKATLTGPAAEVWQAIKEDAKDLNMNDRELLVALLDAGAFTLRKALKSIPR